MSLSDPMPPDSPKMTETKTLDAGEWTCSECGRTFSEPSEPFERYTRRGAPLCPSCVNVCLGGIIDELDSELDAIVECLDIDGNSRSISESVEELATELERVRAELASVSGASR